MVLLCAAAAVAPTGRVALVTGSTRGIGRGIAVELGRAGYTVYTVGRSSRSGGQTQERSMPDGLDLTVESAAEAVSEAGSTGHTSFSEAGGREAAAARSGVGEKWRSRPMPRRSKEGSAFFRSNRYLLS